MVDLHSYDTATKMDCYNDLWGIISELENMTTLDLRHDRDFDILEIKGQRLQYIAQRLKELRRQER